MAVTEEERHELHSWLEGQAGPQIAATLMKPLPQAGWMDVTTNTELEHMRRELTDRIELVETRLTAKLDSEIASFRVEMSDRFEQQTRAMVLAMVGSMATMTSLVVAATGLTG